MRFIKPLDRDAVLRAGAQVARPGHAGGKRGRGGAGSAVSELLAAAGVLLPLLHIGIPDRFIEHGSRDDCLVAAGLDAASVRRRIADWWRTQRAEAPKLAQV